MFPSLRTHPKERSTLHSHTEGTDLPRGAIHHLQHQEKLRVTRATSDHRIDHLKDTSRVKAVCVWCCGIVDRSHQHPIPSKGSPRIDCRRARFTVHRCRWHSLVVLKKREREEWRDRRQPPRDLESDILCVVRGVENQERNETALEIGEKRCLCDTQYASLPSRR